MQRDVAVDEIGDHVEPDPDGEQLQRAARRRRRPAQEQRRQADQQHHVADRIGDRERALQRAAAVSHHGRPEHHIDDGARPAERHHREIQREPHALPAITPTTGNDSTPASING